MDVFNRPAEEFDNDESVEQAWAMKALDHAEVYFNLITSVDPLQLKLTPYDDQIYTEFRKDFPTLDIRVLTDNDLKNTEEKVKWRSYIKKFDKVEDFSFGTLLRADAFKEFSPDNSILVIRIQFLAIEIARNREGVNSITREKFKPKVKTFDENKLEDCSNAHRNDAGETINEI